jgi:hypothetical protein
VIVEDMKNVLGLTFITGIVKKPKLKTYWTDDPVFGTSIVSQNNAPQSI